MRIAVVFYPTRNRDKLLAVSSKLAQGLEQQGHQLTVVDASRDVNTKLSMFEYICVGSQGTAFFKGSIPPELRRFLSGAGIVAGKRSFAFVIKSGLSTLRSLSKLMHEMESEGMFLKYSDVIASEGDALETGKRLKVD
ncbi:MAG: hypothetical protein EA383_09120 [Spirochaetaceae bacterium]|nr:MAG: hypothetical protein EA383_09120 [Spirochaetaceae bacterium]